MLAEAEISEVKGRTGKDPTGNCTNSFVCRAGQPEVNFVIISWRPVQNTPRLSFYDGVGISSSFASIAALGDVGYL